MKDPAIVLARSTDSIFEPEEEYEKKGIVDNVVFPCGMVVEKGVIYIYYGGGDRVMTEIGERKQKLKREREQSLKNRPEGNWPGPELQAEISWILLDFVT